MRGYTFQYQGRNLEITVLDCVEDYKRLLPQLAYSEDYIYYITKERIFVYQGRVIASGNFHSIQQELEGLSVREWVARKQVEMRYGKIDMDNRRKYTYEEKVEKRPIEEVKEENPEWFTETELCEVSDETVMEINIPSADELDDYFSSIGLEIPGGDF